METFIVLIVTISIMVFSYRLKTKELKNNN